MLKDGGAEGSAVLVAAVLGLACGDAGEVVAGVEVFVAEEVVYGAVELAGSGACGEIDDAAVEAAELGGDVVGFDVELADVVEDGEEGDLAGLGLEGGDAVEEVLVGAGAAAVDAGEQGSGRKGYAGCEGGELDEVTAVEWNGRDGGGGDDGLDVAGLRLEKRGVGSDGDGAGVGAEGELEIEAGGGSGGEVDAFADETLEAGCCDFDTVGSGLEGGEGVGAVCGGGGGAEGGAGGLGCGDVGCGEGEAGGVGDAAFELGGDLGAERGGAE